MGTILKDIQLDKPVSEIVEEFAENIKVWMKEGREIVVIGGLTGADAINSSPERPLLRMGMSAPVKVGYGIVSAAEDMLGNNLDDMEAQIAQAKGELIGEQTQQMRVTIQTDTSSNDRPSIATHQIMKDKGEMFDSLQSVIDDCRIRDAGYIFVYQDATNRVCLESNTDESNIPEILKMVTRGLEED